MCSVAIGLMLVRSPPSLWWTLSGLSHSPVSHSLDLVLASVPVLTLGTPVLHNTSNLYVLYTLRISMRTDDVSCHDLSLQGLDCFFPESRAGQRLLAGRGTGQKTSQRGKALLCRLSTLLLFLSVLRARISTFLSHLGHDPTLPPATLRPCHCGYRI